MLPREPDPSHPSFARSDQQHTIETPEQIPPEFPIAGIGSRFLALAVDTLIQVGVGLLIVLILVILGVMTRFFRTSQAGLWVLSTLLFLLFLLIFGYFALFEIVWNGQTPGKRFIGIRVIKDSGRPLAPSEVIGRNLLRILDQLPGFYAVGLVVAMLNAQNRRLGDFVAGSIVVRETAFAQIKPVWQTKPSEGSPEIHSLGAEPLAVEDLALIETFLQRRCDLAPDVRARMADQILDRLKLKMSLPDPGTLSAESILEALAYGRRSSGGYL